MSDLFKNGVVILDFGSQYTQLIARRVREHKVYSEILSPESSLDEILQKSPSAIILSGGPNSVYRNDAPNFDTNILSCHLPIFGICYGLHLLVQSHGGNIVSEGEGEYGFAELNVKINRSILKDIPDSKVWMSHGDRVETLPKNWSVLAESSNGIVAAIVNSDETRVATQFHPEVYHTEFGSNIIYNFLFRIADCKPNWTSENFIDRQISMIKEQVGSKHVITGVSGGVDSTVVAALMNKAVGSQAYSIMIDNGLMRRNEVNNCVSALKKGLNLDIYSYDHSNLFLSKLSGVTDPEKKRKIIGAQFIHSFEKIAKEFSGIKYLAQGTLYPDVIESGSSKWSTAAVIKSHHNVGGLPDKINVKIIEPLKELFKDEVREVGKELGLPISLINRHPFPGPGLGVRIIGEITEERVKTLQKADEIYLEVLHDDNLYSEIWQAFAVLTPIKTVGVMGDKRTYENVLVLRAVTSVDGMTANWFPMPYETLSKISNKIVNSVKGINRVVYDTTSKPPGTIEWE